MMGKINSNIWLHLAGSIGADQKRVRSRAIYFPNIANDYFAKKRKTKQRQEKQRKEKQTKAKERVQSRAIYFPNIANDENNIYCPNFPNDEKDS